MQGFREGLPNTGTSDPTREPLRLVCDQNQREVTSLQLSVSEGSQQERKKPGPPKCLALTLPELAATRGLGTEV